jgi:hypothetical protein
MKFKKPKPISSRKSKNAPTDADTLLDHDNPHLALVPRTTPNELLVPTAGPLKTIQPMPKERRSRDADLLVQLGGDNVVRTMAEMLGRDDASVDLACLLWSLMAPYVLNILGLESAPRLRPEVNGPLATAIKNCGTTPYEALASRMLSRAYEQIRAELEQREASLPIVGGNYCPVILGNYWMARRVYIDEVGEGALRWLETQAFWGSLRCMACALLARLAPDFRPTAALQYLIGLRESSECFLVSELEVALKRDEFEYAEQLAFEPGILNFSVAGQPLREAPIDYRPRHIDTDPSEWRIINNVAEALLRCDWQHAESPARMVVKTTWAILIERRNMHEQEHIDAAKYGCSIELCANFDELIDAPGDALKPGGTLALSQLGTTERGDFASLEGLVEAVRGEIDPKLKAVLELRLQGVPFEDMHGILGWSHHEVKAAQQRWQRLKRGSIARRIAEMQVPSASGPGAFVYRESLSANPHGVLQHMPLDLKFPDGRPAAAAPIVSFRPDSFPASQAIRHQTPRIKSV